MLRGNGFWRRVKKLRHKLSLTVLLLAGDIAVALAPTRWLLSRLHQQERLTIRRLGFEAGFYLRQLPPRRRLLASCDPELHYCVIGWRESRSPSIRCDQVFISARHPGVVGNPYLRVDRFAEARNDLEQLGRVATSSPPRKGYALIFHRARGGGSTKCLGLFENILMHEGYAPLRLRLIPRSDRLVILQSQSGAQVHDIVGGLDTFLASIEGLPVTRVVVSHVIDFPPERIFGILRRIVDHIGCPFDILLHDYFLVCARVNLVDENERTCFTPPSIDQCRTCVGRGGSEIGAVDPAYWRQIFIDFALKAERVIVLSNDMHDRLAPFLDRPLTIWRPEVDRLALPKVTKTPDHEVLRIAVVGGLNVAKGSKVIAALGEAIRTHNAQISIKVFGESPERKLLVQAGITVEGRYRETDLKDMLSEWAPHMAFIPAIWPETWSFVLTHLLDSGLPVIAFDHGAQGERLRAIGRAHHLIPSEAIYDPTALLQWVLRLKTENPDAAPAYRSLHHMDGTP